MLSGPAPSMPSSSHARSVPSALTALALLVRTFAQPTPGPGTYEIDGHRSVTSLLKSSRRGAQDKAQASFRSRTQRFEALGGTFGGAADPLRLQDPVGARRPREMKHFVEASPVAFRRGSSMLLTTAGGRTTAGCK